MLGSGTVTFNDVADFGPGVLQPSIGISELARFTSYPPTRTSSPVKRCPEEILPSWSIPASAVWRRQGLLEGRWLGARLRNEELFWISQIPANPPYGSIGVDLPVVEKASPSLVAWGPTPATRISISIPRACTYSRTTSAGFT